MSCALRRLFRAALLLTFLPLAGSRGALAQATRTASKGADISVFGGVQFVSPAYGPERNAGGVLGVNFTKYFHIPVEPSLELRANFNSGSFIGERSYLFGLRALLPLGRLRPYADFLIGPGQVHYPRNLYYTSDNSTVVNYGGGVDLDITGPFALKLDLQRQHWDTGENPFSPVLGTVGVTYSPFAHRSGRAR